MCRTIVYMYRCVCVDVCVQMCMSEKERDRVLTRVDVEDGGRAGK